MNINDNPNFSIVLPGECNAACSFCFWEQKKSPIKKIYLDKLAKTLDILPNKFKSCSITGGEPTISPYFLDVLPILRERFNKIVLSTNGNKLLDILRDGEKGKIIYNNIDHINISRHAIDQKENDNIFSTNTLTDSQIIQTNKMLMSIGIDITLNCVHDEEIKSSFIYDFCDYAFRTLGISHVCFRQQHGNLKNADGVIDFCDGKIKEEYSCPVCRTISTEWEYSPDPFQNSERHKVSFKTSVIEPSKELKSIYELIFNQDCKLTSDWDGITEITSEDLNPKPSIENKNANIFVGCSGGGCGSRGCG
jgi:hypothetical protein